VCPLTRTDSARRPVDIVVLGVILAFGVLQFCFCDRAADFLHEDVFFADAARSLQHGFYGIDGHPETNQPPGLSAILAILFLASGASHALSLRAMVVFETLGFMASYELLRRYAPRIVAAGICLLLISSEPYFAFATRYVFPCYPYFFTTMTALLVARRLENAGSTRARIAWAGLLAALCAVSLMIASAAIALLGALAVWSGVTFFRDRRLAVARLRPSLVVLLLGTAVQGLWMHRHAAPLEWPIAGYPRPYLSQLMVKDGNDPELGMATLLDIPVRVAKNAIDDSALLSQLLVHRWFNDAWISVATLGPLLLILLGWGSTIWRTGGSLHDWYFAGYELIYLLWPWRLEPRFFFPIAPLACLYLWSGLKALGFLAIQKPRLLGAVWLPASATLTISAWYWTNAHRGLQRELSILAWVVSGLVAAGMVWRGGDWLAQRAAALRIRPLRVSQQFVGVAGIGVIITGLAQQLAVGRDNLSLNSVVNAVPADAKAGMWAASHTDTNAVIMARHVPTAYHFSGRRVVWFPPSSNPQLLIEGIRRLKVDYVVVVHREDSYYMPPDDYCFARLLAAYPDAFGLVFQTPQFRVFLVRH